MIQYDETCGPGTWGSRDKSAWDGSIAQLNQPQTFCTGQEVLVANENEQQIIREKKEDDSNDGDAGDYHSHRIKVWV